VFLADFCHNILLDLSHDILYNMGMEKITSVKDLISIDKDYKDLSRSRASACYGGLAGMLVATVKWAGISIKEDKTAFALEILERATAERKRMDDVVERYNRRFNVKHKEV
jgi:hypothetical protein